MGFFSKIKEGLKKTRDNFVGQINTMLKSFKKIDEELFEELEELLVMADVGVHTAENICEQLRAQVKKEGVSDPSEIMGMLEKLTADMLREGNEMVLNTKPSVVLVIGVNGVGKTTTIGKLANYYVSQGKKVTLAAADTFRAAAIDQLKYHGEKVGVRVVAHKDGADPSAVVFDAVESAKSKGEGLVLVDTAGRLHNKENLVRELQKIDRTAKQKASEGCYKKILVLEFPLAGFFAFMIRIKKYI
mgnify:CR=1 FL=1